MTAVAPIVTTRKIARSDLHPWVKTVGVMVVWAAYIAAIMIAVALVVAATYIIAVLGLLFFAAALLLIPFRW